MKRSMNSMQVGDTATVCSISENVSDKRRLQELGLVEGTVVEALHKSPFGDPVAYLIRGAVIALRSTDSGNITVLS